MIPGQLATGLSVMVIQVEPSARGSVLAFMRSCLDLKVSDLK